MKRKVSFDDVMWKGSTLVRHCRVCGKYANVIVDAPKDNTTLTLDNIASVDDGIPLCEKHDKASAALANIEYGEK